MYWAQTTKFSLTSFSLTRSLVQKLHGMTSLLLKRIIKKVFLKVSGQTVVFWKQHKRCSIVLLCIVCILVFFGPIAYQLCAYLDQSWGRDIWLGFFNIRWSRELNMIHIRRRRLAPSPPLDFFERKTGGWRRCSPSLTVLRIYIVTSYLTIFVNQLHFA